MTVELGERRGELEEEGDGREEEDSELDWEGELEMEGLTVELRETQELGECVMEAGGVLLPAGEELVVVESEGEKVMEGEVESEREKREEGVTRLVGLRLGDPEVQDETLIRGVDEEVEDRERNEEGVRGVEGEALLE